MGFFLSTSNPALRMAIENIMPPNTIRIDLRKEDSRLQRKEVIKALKTQLNVKLSDIDYISTPFSYKSWVITFGRGFDINKIVGKQIELNDEATYIQNYEKPKINLNFAGYKICWLLHNQNHYELKDFVMDLLDPKRIYRQKDSDKGEIRVVKYKEETYIDHDEIDKDENEEVVIKTGNVIINVTYPENIMLPRISGKQKLRGKTIKIITFGEKHKKCFGCRSEDHTIKECPYKNTKCSVCGKNGHQTCTMANRLEGFFENDQPGNAEDEIFNENDVENNLHSTMTNNNNRASSNANLNASFNKGNNNEDVETLQDIIDQNNQNKKNSNSKAKNQNDEKMKTLGKPISKRRFKDASLESNSDMHVNKKFDANESNNQLNEDDKRYTSDSMEEGSDEENDTGTSETEKK